MVLAVSLTLGACGHHIRPPDADNAADDGVNAYPANYKADILAAMHAYLNNPTGIRDAAISEPALKTIGNATRYMACLKFNAKKNATEYAGMKEIAAIFLAGRFDHFIEIEGAYAPAWPIRRFRNCKSCRRDPAPCATIPLSPWSRRGSACSTR